ncbi:MAG TPA: hypothetical protein VGQ08_17040 [Nitrospiraceae bacterium]|jgi:hypothetical protein|nr:hypothetical protein [Nitrospiraceae bacterium]
MPEYTPPPSPFLSASDLPSNEDTVLTITSFTEEWLRQGERQVNKCVLKFAERESGLPLNIGNGKVIVDLYGKEMNNWIDKKITLYVDPNVSYNGSQVSGIRVRPITNKEEDSV